MKTLISYEGSNAKELIKDFHQGVDDYLTLCQQEGISPERTYKGSFNIRISPELHKQAATCAIAQQMTLNKFVETALQRYVTTLL